MTAPDTVQAAHGWLVQQLDAASCCPYGGSAELADVATELLDGLQAAGWQPPAPEGQVAYQRPPKGTPEYDVWVSAIDVVHHAPLKQHASAYAASIPWRYVHELRQHLEAAGIDWRRTHPATRP